MRKDGDGEKCGAHGAGAVREAGEWANEGLRKVLKGMEPREAALATRLVYGVLQNRLWLDEYLRELSSLSLEKLELTVLEILRLGGYQILMMDQIPVRAAVDEAVKLAKKRGKNPRTAGFVNAILRNLDRRRGELSQRLEEKWSGPEEVWQRLSVRYSHPLWLVEEFAGQLDGDATRVEAGGGPGGGPPRLCRRYHGENKKPPRHHRGGGGGHGPSR